MPATVICNSPSRRPLALRPSVPAATATRSPCCDPRLHDLDMAAGGLDFAKPFRPGLWRKILQAAQFASARRHRTAAPAADALPARCRRRSATRFRSQDDRCGEPSAMRPCSSTCLARASGVCTGPLMRSIAGSSNTMRGALRDRRQSDHAAAGLAPVHHHRRRLAAVGNRRRRGEFRDQQFRIVDLRDHQDFAELRGERRLRAPPAVCDTSATLAPSQRTSSRNGKPATERLRAIIDPAGFRFPRPPGIGA